MQNPTATKAIQFAKQEWLLLPEKCVFDAASKTLVVSDVHLGKAPYFQQAGLAVPAQMGAKDLARLSVVMAHYQPKTLVFLGDLFHATSNSDWELLTTFCATHHTTTKILVQGNHDILQPENYAAAGLAVVPHCTLGAATLVHEATGAFLFEIAGHIHPGVLLRGKAKQQLRLPCFVVGTQQLLLPAFGTFTGLAIQHPKKSWVCYPVAAGSVFDGVGA